MLFISVFFISIVYAFCHKSVIYWFLFQLLVITAIIGYIFADIDVLYKADVGLISDTRIYYESYIAPWGNIRNGLFAEYSYFLRVFTYPWINSLYATWGQSTLLFLLFDIIIKNKVNLLFILSFHALIYTSTNLFKDNLILIVGLCGYITLKYLKYVWLQCIVIAICILIIARIRPFIGYAIPVAFSPLLFRIKSINIKKAILLFAFIGVVIFLYLQRSFFLGIINSFSDDSAVSEGRSSFIVALFKIFLGPTPLHYIHSKQYLEQPLLAFHSYFYGIIHYIYYISFAFICVYVVRKRNEIFNMWCKDIAKIYLLFLGLIQLIVYTIVYCSADIRQRCVIGIFIFLYCVNEHEPVYTLKFKRNMLLLLLGIFIFLNLLTFIYS